MKSWQEFRFTRDAIESIARIRTTTLRVVVVTNQSAVNRGLVGLRTLDEIHRRMQIQIENQGGRIDGVFYCPHLPEEVCGCRKPGTGLLIQASASLGIQLKGSYMIGDSVSDAMAGIAVGCHSIIIGRRNGGESLGCDPPNAAMFCPNLSDAVDYVCKKESSQTEE